MERCRESCRGSCWASFRGSFRECNALALADGGASPGVRKRAFWPRGTAKSVLLNAIKRNLPGPGSMLSPAAFDFSATCLADAVYKARQAGSLAPSDHRTGQAGRRQADKCRGGQAAKGRGAVFKSKTAILASGQ